MRQETRRALLRELEDRGFKLDLEDDGRNASFKDVVRAVKRAAHDNKINCEGDGEEEEEGENGHKKWRRRGHCKEQTDKDKGCSVCGRMLLVSLVLALAIAMVVVGAKRKDLCPVEKMVPIWLIGELLSMASGLIT